MSNEGNEEIRPVVSVVIPVYNVELFLRASLDCICNQTYTQLQIICVNDGSTDSSPEILKEYAEKDERFVVLHQENGGQSVARNVGVEHATGKYLYFMDSDDLLETNAIEKLVTFAEKNKLNLVVFDADVFSEESEMLTQEMKYEDWYRRDAGYPEICKGSELFRMMVKKNQFIAPVWVTFMRRSYFEEKGLWFHPGIIMEDFPYTVPAYLYAEQIGYIHEKLFHRRVRSGSTMTAGIAFSRPYGYFAGLFDVIDYVNDHPLTLTPEETAALDSLLKKRLRIVKQCFFQLAPEEAAKINDLSTRERMLFRLMIGEKKKPFLTRVKLKVVRKITRVLRKVKRKLVRIVK